MPSNANLPNSLTLVRIALIPLLVVVFFYLPREWAGPLAAIVFGAAGLTDWLDGYLARKLGRLSRVLKRNRKKERVRLEAWLDRKRLRKLREDLEGALRAVRQTGRGRTAAPMDLSPFFSRILTLYSDHAWSTDTKAAHHVRHEVRFLRYAYETLEWAYPPDEFQGARSQLQRVQQLAGSWHDRTMLEEMAGEAEREGAVGVPMDRLLVRVRAESRSFIQKFVKATATLIHLRSQIEGNHE